MTILGAIGDIRRFEDAKHLVGYAGLGAGVHDSGKEHKDKGITKSGRKELRWALVEAAWRGDYRLETGALAARLTLDPLPASEAVKKYFPTSA